MAMTRKILLCVVKFSLENTNVFGRGYINSLLKHSRDHGEGSEDQEILKELEINNNAERLRKLEFHLHKRQI